MPKIVPFRDLILVKRIKLSDVSGEKLGKEGILIAPKSVQEHKTDIAEIVHLPDKSLADDVLLSNVDAIVKSVGDRAKEGSYSAVDTLMNFRGYLLIKTLKVGDKVMISKYVGTNFFDNQGDEELTMVRETDILGVVNG